MKQLVVKLAAYGRSINPKFLVITHNTPELAMASDCDTTVASCQLDRNFTNIVDAWAVSNLLYGADQDDAATPVSITNKTLPYLRLLKSAGEKVMVMDFCWTFSNLLNSYAQNNRYGFISYANYRSLASMPAKPAKPFNMNSRNVTSPADAKNFIFLVNPTNFASKFDFLFKINVTNFDMLVISPYANQTNMYGANELSKIKTKQIGGKRLVICYLNVGEASDYLPYWDNSWQSCSGFVDGENPGIFKRCMKLKCQFIFYYT
jgi:cysteinyl-tRNA synthetase